MAVVLPPCAGWAVHKKRLTACRVSPAPTGPHLRTARPNDLSAGGAVSHRESATHPDLPAPRAVNLVENIVAAYAYHLNIMPLDAHMPYAGALCTMPVPASSVT